MERKKKKSHWAELRVGIMVVIVFILFAAALLNIGKGVGLFTPKLKAKTYLNNTAGLKPGDIVLLNGIEVGNIEKISIKDPATDKELQEATNYTANQRQIGELANRVNELSRQVASNTANLRLWNAEQRAAVERTNRRLADELERRIDQLETINAETEAQLKDAQANLELARRAIKNIEIVMDIEEKYRDYIKADSDVSLGNVGLLGDKYLGISVGRSNLPPKTTADGTILITGTTQADIAELITSTNDVISNFGVLSQKLDSIMTKFDQGQGSIGKFINDPTFYNNLNSTMTEARRTVDAATNLIKFIHEGEGTVARLVRDREIYDKMNSTMTRLESTMREIQEGKGSLSRFIHDPEFYNKANSTVQNIDLITKRINAGEGTLGKFATDEVFYKRTNEAIERVNKFLDQVDKGQGTLGKLARDEALYNNVSAASSEIVKLLYDFRKDPKRFLTINFKIF
ncbi:MAG: hypothetical protein ACR2L2_03380 [Acidobacteriota bacterium]